MPDPGLFQGLPTPPLATPTPTPPSPPALRSTPIYSSEPPSIGALLESGEVGPASLLGLAGIQDVVTGQGERAGGAPTGDLPTEILRLTNEMLAETDPERRDALQLQILTLTNTYSELRKGGLFDEGGAGGAAPIFSPQEERLMTDLQNAVNVGQMSDEQAWREIENYWSEESIRGRRSEEAGQRGETLLAGAFPGTTLPMTGPGGMGAALEQKYGLPNLLPGIQGLPMQQAQGIFGQAQQGMGLPAQLPPIQPPTPQMMNWGALGQNLPSFGGGNYFETLLQEGRSTAPAL